jgi:LuxR family transcriptional regulator, maltose regulon positive regulatory protein
VATTKDPEGAISSATPQYGPLFEAKFQGVRSSDSVLVRPRLTEGLTESRTALVLLAAPPGFGKTTLLAQWREQDSRSFVCVSLDATDNDPTVFWSYLVEAVRRVEPGFGDTVLRALRTPRVEAVAPAFLSDLESLGGELVLVLDDYQAIENRACHESVAFLLERLPANVTLAISTRVDPPIGIGRLRAARELVELRALDLCFTLAEEAELLNGTLELGLSDENVAVLHECTEGWPVGVQLASLSLREAGDLAAFVACFGGSSRHVVDYLTEVVLDTLDSEHRRFLLETSILESMCGPLCDVVTGRKDSDERLLGLERANLFLLPLDDRREWYRYHQLFLEVLRHHLLRDDPDHARELHRRASEWLAGAGQTLEAVRHAIAAGELEAAARLVAERWVSLHALGRPETLLRWLEPFPAEVVAGDARLLLAQAWALSMLDRRGEASETLEDVHAAGTGGQLPDGTSLETVAALLRASFPCGDAGTTLTAAAHAFALEAERRSAWQPTVLLALGWARYLAGEADEARAPLGEAALVAARAKQWLAASTARAVLGLACLEVDDVAAAEGAAREGLRLAEEHDLVDEPGAGVVYAALGALVARNGELDKAARLLERGIKRLRARGEELYLADALLTLAPVRRSLGAREEARALLAEARALVEGCADPGMLPGRLEDVTRSLVPAHRRIEGDSELTERELEVLRYLAEGLPKREIGRTLFLSFNTIHSHTKSIYQKLRVSSRQAAVQRARELGAL